MLYIKIDWTECHNFYEWLPRSHPILQVAIMYVPALAIGTMLPPILVLLAIGLVRKHIRCSANRAGKAYRGDGLITAPESAITKGDQPRLLSRATLSPEGGIRLAPLSSSIAGIYLHKGRLDIKRALRGIISSYPDAVEIQVLVGGKQHYN